MGPRTVLAISGQLDDFRIGDDPLGTTLTSQKMVSWEFGRTRPFVRFGDFSSK